jgi:hypothetical protein
MKGNYKDALAQLQKAQVALNAQNISALPKAQLIKLELSKAAVFSEIQALEASQIEDRDGDYTAVTTAFRNCKSQLTELSNWVSTREARDRALFSMLAKGVSIALTLL